MSETTTDSSLALKIADLTIATRNSPEYLKRLQTVLDECIAAARAAASEGKSSFRMGFDAWCEDEIRELLECDGFYVSSWSENVYEISWHRHIERDYGK